MRSPKNRSLLNVNEDFEGKHNDKIHFLFSLLYHLIYCCLVYQLQVIDKHKAVCRAGEVVAEA